MANRTKFLLAAFVYLGVVHGNATAFAHCDTVDGPVAKDARLALESRDPTPVLKWVMASDEAVIKKEFANTLDSLKKGKDAGEAATRRFLEALVRIHRASENAPYTGLKPADAVDPAVAAVDLALERGSADEVLKWVPAAKEKVLREQFARTMAARKQKDESVAAGRRFVREYVVLTHSVEGTMQNHGAHHHH